MSVLRNLAARKATRLIEQGHFSKADAFLERALSIWPLRPHLLHLYAMSAHASGRHRVALTRWGELCRIDPTRPFPWVGIASNHRALEELQPAEATVREALARFPDDLVVAVEAACLFDRLGAQAEAEPLWRRLCECELVREEWYQGHAFCLASLGRFEEAEDVLDRADDAYPGQRDLLSTRAYLEAERGNWNGALLLWRAYRERYPEDQAGWEGQGRTIAAIHAARMETTGERSHAEKVDIDVVENDACRILMLGFESIGADCEFGLVQRRFGAEPLGLLRFNDVGLPNLLAALDARFDGMGDTVNTELVVSDSSEFYVTDRRWQLGMHTFMFSSRYDASALLPKMCRRVSYLRDKLLADLREAEKTFVFKTDGVDLDGLRELHRALKSFGPVRLLHVRRVSVPLTDWPTDAAPGQVALVEPGLYVGYLSRMGNADAARGWDIAFDEWVSICGGLFDAHALPGLQPR